jgi:hypothetical protein
VYMNTRLIRHVFIAITIRVEDMVIVYSLLISLRFRTKQVIKVMRAKDKGGKKVGSNN